jgi:hypothetical protein
MNEIMYVEKKWLHNLIAKNTKTKQNKKQKQKSCTDMESLFLPSFLPSFPLGRASQ